MVLLSNAKVSWCVEELTPLRKEISSTLKKWKQERRQTEKKTQEKGPLFFPKQNNNRYARSNTR